MSSQRPTIGRIVHYVSHGTPPRHDGTQAYASACRAAIVTSVDGRAGVSLCVLNPEGLFFNRGVKHSDGHEGGTWHWPERDQPEVEINVSAPRPGMDPRVFENRYRGRAA